MTVSDFHPLSRLEIRIWRKETRRSGRRQHPPPVEPSPPKPIRRRFVLDQAAATQALRHCGETNPIVIRLQGVYLTVASSIRPNGLVNIMCTNL
jgi:hypothetical protein